PKSTGTGHICDPYVVLTMGDQTAKTLKVRRTMNPRWGQQFYFNVTGRGEALSLTVLDGNTRPFSRDIVMGKATLPLSDLAEHTASNRVLPLALPGKPDGPVIVIQVRFEPTAGDKLRYVFCTVAACPPRRPA